MRHCDYYYDYYYYSNNNNKPSSPSGVSERHSMPHCDYYYYYYYYHSGLEATILVILVTSACGI